MNLHIINGTIIRANIIWANIIVSIKSFYREKTVVFFRLAFPVILILVFGTIFMERDNEIFELSIQDLSRTTSSEELVNALRLSKRFKITLIPPAANAKQYAKANKRNLIVIIPKDFEMSLMQKMGSNDFDTAVSLTQLYDPGSFGVTTKIGVLDMVLAGINQKMSGKPPLIVSEPVSILKKKYRFIEFFVPGVIAMAVMTASLFGSVNVNAELLQKGVIRKLSTTPITRMDWILSNVLYQFILAVLSTAVMLLVSYIVFNVSLEINAWLVVFVALNVFSFVGLGMILTRVAKEAESASAAADALMFPMMFLSGTFFPVEMMPEFLQKFAKVLPLYYVNEGLRAAMVAVDHTAALKCALIIGAFAAVVFVLGIMITKLGGETP
jgi:ABC-2 type transport system permease protein